MNELTKAAQDVLAERQRQVTVEGWTPEHDDEHPAGTMAAGGACYALWAASQGDNNAIWNSEFQKQARRLWQWDAEWWKPKDAHRNLVRAAALLLAEIERMDRAATHGKPETREQGKPPRCKRPDESTEDYRIAMGWDKPFHPATDCTRGILHCNTPESCKKARACGVTVPRVPDAFDRAMLTAAASSGDPGAMSLAAQLAGVPPCTGCGYRKGINSLTTAEKCTGFRRFSTQ